MLRSLKAPILVFALAIALGPLIDFTLNAYIKLVFIYVIINIILALSLNLVNGFTGQFSLGHAGFMAVGAYVSALLSLHTKIFSGSLEPINFLLFTLCGGAVASVAGYLVGLPSLRLRGDYLAIVTLGFGEIIRVVILNFEFMGGARGLFGIPSIPDGIVSSFVGSFWLASFWLTVCLFVISRLVRSSYGRSFLSVREDEIAAEAMGVNATRAKVQSFVVSSFFAGVAGAIFAHYAAYLNPSTFSFMKSVDAVIMVVLGGMGSLTGSVVAAVFITLVPELLRPLQDITGVDLRMIIYSLALILLMILRPKGLFGSSEITDLFPTLRSVVRKKEAAS